MSEIIPSMLRVLTQAPTPLAEVIAPALDAHLDEYGVTTVLRRAHLLGQLCYESAGFARMTENLDYSAGRIAAVWPRLKDRAEALEHKPEALANAAYAERLGNGDEASGDGWRFRGRGLIQLTGRDNYRERGEALGIDLIAEPDQAATPEIAARIALAFWKSRGCNEHADRDDVGAVTLRLNGSAMEGFNVRLGLTRRAKAILEERGLIA